MTLTDLGHTPNKPAWAFSPANSRKQPPKLDPRSSGRYEGRNELNQSPLPWRQAPSEPYQSPSSKPPPMMSAGGSPQAASAMGARAAQQERQLAALKRELAASQQQSHSLQGEFVTVSSVVVLKHFLLICLFMIVASFVLAIVLLSWSG